LNKYKETEICGLPTVEELRSSLLSAESSNAREIIATLFDKDTFIEVGAYTKRAITDFLSTEKANEFEGVICGYGAIDGKLVFAFAEDSSRMGGVIDERHAKKISDLYALALSNGAPVIGIFDSKGTDVFEGAVGLAAYGKIISCVSKASGKIPQIAFVAGKCIGTCAAIASMFDFVVKADDADFYVSSPVITKKDGAQDMVLAYSAAKLECVSYIRALVSFIPDNSSMGIIVNECTDNLNKMLGELDFAGDAASLISTIADNSIFYEVAHDFEPSVLTALSSIGGVKCGIVANAFSVNEGKLSASAARKISKFVNYCDAYSIPVVTLVDSLGLDTNPVNETSYFAPELAKLAYAYTNASVPKITVIMGHAIGASFVLLGSKALGADIVYATANSEICALNAESGVAFAWDKYITLEQTRESLVNKWKASVSSPAVAAASGEIDDIISVNELRARICSALLMLSSKGSLKTFGRKILPL
jgi:acetyl-CoA carboxylase carboxyltransferase component